MSDPLHGFDMAVCLTQNAVNAQMGTMSHIGKLDPSKAFFPEKVDWKFSNGSLNATLGTPSVDFMPANSNYQQMIFILPFTSGELVTYTFNTSTTPPTTTMKKADVSGWQVAFTVNLADMAFGTAARDAATKSGALTAAAQAKLAANTDDLFDVKALILDFTKSQIADFDPTYTKMPGVTEAEQVAVATALKFFFKDRKDPFIIAVHSSSKNPAATATAVAPTLVPTGAVYTVFGNASAYTPVGPANGISTLNVLVTTDDHASIPAKPAGIFTTPFVTDNLNSGQLVLSRPSLVDNFLLKKFGEKLGSQFVASDATTLTSVATRPSLSYTKEGTLSSPGTVKTTGKVTVTTKASLSQDKPEINFTGTIAIEAAFRITFIWSGTWTTWRNVHFSGKISLTSSQDTHSLAVKFNPFKFSGPVRPRKDNKDVGANVDEVITLGAIDNIVDDYLTTIRQEIIRETENILEADQVAVPTLSVPPTGASYAVTPSRFNANGDCVVNLNIETKAVLTKGIPTNR